MKVTYAVLISSLCLSGAKAAAIRVANGTSNSWGGSSLYFLHGMSSEDQDSYINQMADAGAKVMRLWVTATSKQCEKGSNVATALPDLEHDSIGAFDDTVLDALDVTIGKLAAKGMKALISPHDGNAFGINSKDVYFYAYGDQSTGDVRSQAGSFYTDSNAASQIDQRYQHIINYKSKAAGGKTWGEWTEGIMGFDLENEPMQQSFSTASNNDPSGWFCGRANAMRQALGANSPIKILTGGIGGDQSNGYNFLDAALKCGQIDIMAIHAYVSTANFWPSYIGDNLPNAKNNNKLVMVEEFGVEKDWQSQFDEQVAAINNLGVPWTYWQVTQYDQGSCGDNCCPSNNWDGFEVGLQGSKGNPQQALSNAASTSGAQDWSGIIY